MPILDRITGATSRILISGAPEGYDVQLMTQWAHKTGRALLIVQDDQAMARAEDTLRFFAPDLECLGFPAWDCLPYDRVSPNADVLNRRMRALNRLLKPVQTGKPQLILTTVSAYLQRVLPR
ncbi:MAG: transcription-repair coupling factor, partial [Rhodospirillales bacterium]|nr:transcription-repair coupling factor [Rhodospirillales bacterium]